MVVELKEVILNVQDINTQVAFYQGVLGLRVIEPQGMKDFREFYTVKLQTTSCMLILQNASADKHEPHENQPRLVFRIPDMEATRKKLLERGMDVVEVQSPGQGVWTCEGRDPEGHPFTLEASKKTRNPLFKGSISSPTTASFSATSGFGRLISLLRYNKLAITIEIILVLAAYYFLLYFAANFMLAMCILILFVLWLRGSNLSALGVKQPSMIRITVFLGIIAGIFLYIIQIVFVAPIVAQAFPTPPDVHIFNPIKGNIPALINILVGTWTSAAVGEEFIFRGYLLNRLTDIFGQKTWGWITALLLQALFFGLGHFYQGISGVTSTAIDGLLLGALYIAARRNLWLPVVAHGTIDTISFLFAFFGL